MKDWSHTYEDAYLVFDFGWRWIMNTHWLAGRVLQVHWLFYEGWGLVGWAGCLWLVELGQPWDAAVVLWMSQSQGLDQWAWMTREVQVESELPQHHMHPKTIEKVYNKTKLLQTSETTQINDSLTWLCFDSSWPRLHWLWLALGVLLEWVNSKWNKRNIITIYCYTCVLYSLCLGFVFLVLPLDLLCLITRFVCLLFS